MAIAGPLPISIRSFSGTPGVLAGRSEAFTPNTPGNKVRVNAGVRTVAEPSPLEKLGHMVLSVADSNVPDYPLSGPERPTLG